MVTETSVTRYVCEHCGTAYNSKEEAEKCTMQYLWLKEFEETAKP
jgi:hypothetical protein